MIKYLISFFLSFVLIVSCASKDEKLQNYKDYVQKISSEIKYDDGFNTIKVIGERRSIFRSYFIDDKLVFINEEMSIGNRGSSLNHYYYRDGEVIHYVQKSIITKDDSLNITSKTMVNMDLYLDGKTVLESEYWVGSNQTVITEGDVNNVITHGKLLKQLAEKNRPRKKE